MRRVLAILVCLALGGTTWVFYIKHKSKQCLSNVAKIENALMTYSVERKKIPNQLAELVPDYLPNLPKCPVAHLDTYSPAFIKDGYVHCTARTNFRHDPLGGHFHF